MPCVSLKHHYARRALLKAAQNSRRERKKSAKLAKRQQRRQSPVHQPSVAASAASSRPTTLVDGVSVNIPHQHPSQQSIPKKRLCLTRADLINAESRFGSTIFGPIPDGHRREFFHDQKNIWIWHEDWTDQQNKSHQITVRYEVRTSGVYKKIAAGEYFKLEGDELENFRKATHAYLFVIKKHLYGYSKSIA